MATSSSRSVPEPDEHARIWAGMSFAERRLVLKAVNRGQAMDKRADARVAVGTARQQLRYWRWAWLFGPLIGLVFIPEWVAVAVNGGLGTLMMGGLSWFRIRRAREAEQANLDRIQKRKR